MNEQSRQLSNRKSWSLALAVIMGLGVIAPTQGVVRGKTDAKPVIAEPVAPEQRSRPELLLDVPLRDPSICRGPDGTYYLTGTLSFKDKGEDFDNNAGIRLWKSKDLKNWEDIGIVWNPGDRKDAQVHNWVTRPVGKMDRPETWRHNSAITAPEIHYLNGTFWLCFSRNDFGTGLLKSASGKPEGPYVAPGEHSCITTWGQDPSLFQDDDGAIYWLWGGGAVFIAKMKDNLSGLAEEPRLLTCRPPWLTPKPTGLNDDVVGRGGPFLYKVNGKYHLIAADIVLRFAVTLSDVYIATATNSVYGPYERRQLFLPHSGQSTAFADAAGQWRATFCGRDGFAVFRDKAGLLPLEWLEGHLNLGGITPRTGVAKIEAGPLMTRNRYRVITERGPWLKIRPLLDIPIIDGESRVNIWDTNMIQAPDGYFYFTGSQTGRDIIKKLRVWRSRDLKNWEEHIVRSFADEKVFSPERRAYTQPNWGLSNNYMDCKISWLDRQKTFAVTYTIYGIKGKDAEQFTKEEASNVDGCLVSTSGTIQGPWVWHDRSGHSMHYTELADGRTVCGGGVNSGRIYKPGYWDEHGVENTGDRQKRFTEWSGGSNPPDTFGGYVEDSGTQLIRIDGKWVMLPTECAASKMGYPADANAYSSVFMVADDPKGPWSKWKPATRHGGHAFMFQGLNPKTGRSEGGPYYALVWHTTILGAIRSTSPALVRLIVEWRDGELFIDIDENWTADDYVPPASVK